DLHMHTHWSHDCAMEVPDLLAHAEAEGLAAIAITDHNVFGGAQEAAGARTSLTIIPGEEVKTDGQGEVIGLFLSEEIPRGLSFTETVAAIRKQGGVVYLPHPFDRLHSIPGPATLHRHLDEIDVLEVYNARLLFEAYNDGIFDKYLQKAIGESNELGDEIARAAGEGRVPVLGSGHPLADVMLLKHAPQPSEVQEGVAFYGRAGQAILKSLQRLRVDPMAIYGTNCLKFADVDEEESRPFLLRELHIVGPKLVVAMGEHAVAFLNALAFPLADAVDPEGSGLQRWTPTIQALAVPDIDESLDEQPAKTRFWNAFKALGPWWAELPPY